MASSHSAPSGQPLGALLDIVRDLRLTWRLYWDKRVPLWIKGVPLLSLAYVLWPLDVLIDPILGLGQLDDAAIILLGLKLFLTLCPDDLVALHRQRLVANQKTRSPSGDQVIETTYRVVDDK